MLNTLTEQQVKIPARGVTLEGNLVLPPSARAVVIFAHGSGSSRHSPRNRFVAGVLQDAGIGTLLFDLLTRDEDTVYENRFNIELLTERLKSATIWLRKQPQAAGFSLGYFGASTGTASALRAAAGLGKEIGAVVSRGGRPDMAYEALPRVQAPVLLIVGGSDFLVIELNRSAYDKITAEKRLEIVPGATHLFEEHGALEEVARLAADWFKKHLTAAARQDGPVY
jgi:putative phosphoribosyl transferase